MTTPAMTIRQRLAALLLTGAMTVTQAQSVDTSEWACNYCPFERGATAEFDVGAASVSDDSAYVGDATGLDEQGVYADVGGTGMFSTDTHRIVWMLDDLGLDSRSASLDGGRPGVYGYSLAYSELPRRQFDSTRTVFIASGVDDLTLPTGWVRAPQTGGLTALDASLVRRDIESDRSLIEIGGRYLGIAGFSASADYRRREYEGTKIVAGSTFTNASLLPMPFDYVTDEVDLGVRYRFTDGFVSLGWYLSDFSNSGIGLDWQNPFTTAAGAELSTLARAPDSRFQQLTLKAGYALPAYRTNVSASLSTGSIEQDPALNPYTTNGSLLPDSLPRTSLDGEVETRSAALAATSRLLDNLRVRFSYRYDERDNTTPVETWNRVIVDTFVSGEAEQNVAYSYERSAFKLSGDYDLFADLRLSAGFERRTIDRDFQEVAEQTEDTGWGRVRWRPLDSIEINASGGTSRRDIDAYNETAAASFGQNPLLRKYNLAYRYRQFGELDVSWSPLAVPVSIGVSAVMSDDSYTRSRLGVTDADERSIGIDVGWTVSERASIYVNAGFDEIESEQRGSQQFAAPDWSAIWEDSFDTFGAGLTVAEIADKVDLRVDFLHSSGESTIAVSPTGSATSSFPDLETTLDDVRVGLRYRYSQALDYTFDLRWQQFDTDDWSLAGVAPDTDPVILSLGAMPYDEDVLIVTIGVRYRPGANKNNDE